jgi:hypothetical protein
MHSRVPASAHRPHQRRRLERSFKLAEYEDVDRVAGQLQDHGSGVVGVIDGVPVAVELAGEEHALSVVGAGNRQGVLCRRICVQQEMGRHVVSRRLRSAVQAPAWVGLVG